MARRRRKRSSTELLAKRTIIDIKAKKRAFLKDVSSILSEALGFQVKVSLAQASRTEGFSPDMRRAARMTKAQARRQAADSMWNKLEAE